MMQLSCKLIIHIFLADLRYILAILNLSAPCRAPFAPVFRNIALVAVNGSKDLPKYCLAIAGGSFGSAILFDALRDILARKFTHNSIWVKIVPIPSMLGIPSFIGYVSTCFLDLSESTRNSCRQILESLRVSGSDKPVQMLHQAFSRRLTLT